MSQPSGYNPLSLTQQPVSNYFTNKNWVTIDQRGLIYTTYTRGPSNENTFYEQLPFFARPIDPVPDQPTNMPYKRQEKPLCEQYKCAKKCSKRCNKMNCYKRPNLKK